MAVRIGDVAFPHNCFCATGARGFFGEGYWFHKWLKLFGLTWQETNLAAKTTTYERRIGNMILAADGISPAGLSQRCIIVHLQSGHALNAVGLSGPGAMNLLDRGLWQNLAEPFSLSFMAVGKSYSDRMEEYRLFANLLLSRLPKFKAPFVLQLNFGCPNAGLALPELRKEIMAALDIMAHIGVPLVPNFNPLVPASLLRELQDSGLCDAFWIANTIPYDFNHLGWSIFGSEVSPLTKRGFPSAGGISGPRCLRFTLQAIEEALKAGVTLPIIGGNGIQTPEDVESIKKAGATGIAIGSIAMNPLRVQQMRAVIRAANNIMGN